MTYSYLKIHRHDNIVTLTIDRPDKLNALSEAVLCELERCLGDLVHEPLGTVRGLILTGAGQRAFIAGADIASMHAMSPEAGAEFGRLGQRVTCLLEALPYPVIACVNGYALGGGCEMAMACDYIYATSNAVFGQPEVNLGLVPGFGGCVRLARFVGVGRAKEMILFWAEGRRERGPRARLGQPHLFLQRRDALGSARVAVHHRPKRSGRRLRVQAGPNRSRRSHHSRKP